LLLAQAVVARKAVKTNKENKRFIYFVC
jgi:hypothetical protein